MSYIHIPWSIKITPDLTIQPYHYWLLPKEQTGLSATTNIGTRASNFKCHEPIDVAELYNRRADYHIVV